MPRRRTMTLKIGLVMTDWILRKQTVIDSGADSRDGKPKVNQQGKLKQIVKKS